MVVTWEIPPPSEGLVVVAGVGGVAERLADVAVGPLVALAAVVGAVRGGVGHLLLGGAVLGVVQVEAVADVTEQPRGNLLLHRLLVGAVGGGGGETDTLTSQRSAWHTRQQSKRHLQVGVNES